MKEKLEQPEMRAQWEQRSRIIEPRFAQLKQHDGFRRWTVWGLETVRTQWSVLCATLNLRILYKRWQWKVQGGLALAAIVLGRLQVGVCQGSYQAWARSSTAIACAT